MTKDALTPVWDKLAQLRPNIGSVGDDTVFIEAMSPVKSISATP